NLLFEVGRQWGGRGLDEWASTCWVRAFHFPGPHRMHILNAVAGRMPAATLLELFKPQWDTLPGLWPSYRAAANEERNALLAYARQQAESEAPAARPDKALFIWHALAQMQRDADASEAAIASLIRACQAAPTDYSSRLWLGLELLEAGRLADAEAQLRWCHDRRPGDRKVAEALATIARGRLAAADGAVPR
ncbi:MAG TPA: hypothetical protein VEQ85_07460, partial [Lacipirellulaceae bacterium]|nr:hypothetical protein [Lacipirellulaceae bacterium]